MTAALTLGFLAWIDLAGFFVMAAAAALGAYVLSGRPGLRGLCVALLVVFVTWAMAIGLPRALRVPAVVMDLDGIWCAPWSKGIPWRAVGAVSSREEKLDDRGWRPTDVVLKLAEPAGAGVAPTAWAGVEPRWLRPLVWATRRTPSHAFDSFEGPVAYCNSQSLDTTHETLERLARDLLQIDREMRAEPERRAVFTLCQRGGRALTIACVENIARNHRACEAYGAGGFEACLADFSARIDEAAAASPRGGSPAG
jgi:hypothetical protein